MIFDLKIELLESIIAALENQEEAYCVDAMQSRVVPCSDDTNSEKERFYPLPVWDRIAGFKLREQFLNSLQNNVAHDILWDTLHSGRGVFKKFKEELRKHTDIYRFWHIYKNLCMRKYVYEWYDSLREIWGLEKLNREYEEIDDLVHKDFTFRSYDAKIDDPFIESKVFVPICECNAKVSIDVLSTIVNLWNSDFKKSKSDFGFTCLTPLDEIVGVAVFSSAYSDKKNVYALTCLFILPEFRHMGIGRELLQLSFDCLCSKGIAAVIAVNAPIQKSMSDLLDEFGFIECDFGFVLDLMKYSKQSN